MMGIWGIFNTTVGKRMKTRKVGGCFEKIMTVTPNECTKSEDNSVIKVDVDLRFFAGQLCGPIIS